MTATDPAVDANESLLVVVVRDQGSLDRWHAHHLAGESLVGVTVASVGSIFDALAEVRRHQRDAESACLTRAARRVVLCAAQAVRDEDGLHDALHRIDPGARLVVVADRPSAAAVLCADRTVAGDRDAERSGRLAADLAAALEIPFPNAEEEPKSRPPVASAEFPPIDSGTPPMRTPPGTDRRSPAAAAEPASTEARRERDVVDLVIGDALEAFAARTRKAPPPRSPVGAQELPARPTTTTSSSVAIPAETADEACDPDRVADAGAAGLGDIDLVEAVRRGDELLLARAVALIQSELVQTDPASTVRFEPVAVDTAQGDDGHGAPVERDGRRFGRLVSPSHDSEALRPWAEWLGHWLALERDMRELERLAYTDELTGAGSRRAFERVLDESIADARRRRRTATLMFFDIDDFKSYNDRFGHEAGDAVLRETVALLRAVIRKGDRVFRVGGDEFVVLFADNRGEDGGPSTTGSSGIESVETIAHRFRDRVAELRLAQLGVDAPGTIGISAGIATYPWDGHDARSLLRHADSLALQSKRSGKNAISFGPGAKEHCRGS